MTQMNICMKQNQRYREQAGGCRGGRGGEVVDSKLLGLADANYYIQDG